MVFFNGDVALPGCRECRKKINLTPFITAITADASVDPGGASCTINLSIPRHFGESVLKDGAFILKPGLEVHIYFRGYFPVTNLMSGIDIDGVDVSDIPQYPYYQVFHGIVLNADYEYSGGYYTASVSCGSILHLWQYINMCTSGSAFGPRPHGSNVTMNLTGNNFNGMSPFSIIYSLYRDTAGAAGGVNFALNQSTNISATSGIDRNSEFSLTGRYWERRFAQGMYNLRMYGVSGRLFSAFEQAHFARGVKTHITSRSQGRRVLARDPYIITLSDVAQLARTREGTDVSTVRVDQMVPFVSDVSQWGNVNMFESTYESKLEVATQASQICGYELFQDVDGDLVFKPPFYNLDTKASRVYNILPEDIISFSSSEKEPEATYVVCKGSTFKNLAGLGMDNEWGVQGTFVDFRLIGQFGWRPGNFETAFYSDGRSAFYAAAARLAVLNAGCNSCSITIPLRPEIRPGLPVYIKDVDCYYYVQSFSHSFNFGGQCTTSLQLVARRKKFYPPGPVTVPGVGGETLKGVDLSRTDLPPKPLQSIGPDSVPRIVGFPNVVMALDPLAINMMNYLVAPDTLLRALYASGDRGEVARSRLIHLALEQGVLALASVDDTSTTETHRDRHGTATTHPGHPQPPATEPLSEHDQREAGPWSVRFSDTQSFIITRDQLESSASRNYLRRLVTSQGSQSRRSRQRRPRNQPLTETQIRDHRVRTGTAPAELPDSQTTIPAEFDPSRPVDHMGAIGLFTVLQLVRQRLAQDREVDESYGTNSSFINQSANLLEILSSRKSAFSPNLSGEYRYYSCSHPNPDMQGPVEIETDMVSNSIVFATPTERRFLINRMVLPCNNISDPRAENFVSFEKGTAIRGFKAYHVLSNDRANPYMGNNADVAAARASTSTTGTTSEMEFSDEEAQSNLSSPDPTATTGTSTNTPDTPPATTGTRGVPHQNRHSTAPARARARTQAHHGARGHTEPVPDGRVGEMVGYSIISTQDIFALTFQHHRVRIPVNKMVYSFNGGNYNFLSFKDKMAARLMEKVGTNSPSDVQAAVNLMTDSGQLGRGMIKFVSNTQARTIVVFNGSRIIANGRVRNLIPPGTFMPISRTTLLALADALGDLISQDLNDPNPTRGYNGALHKCFADHNVPVNTAGYQNSDVQAEVEFVLASWSDCIGALEVRDVGAGNVSQHREIGYQYKSYTSPVFPVSDEQGYEVFGSYPYGRGLNIQGNSNFQRLMSDNDPLRLVGRDTNIQQLVESYVRALTDTSVTETGVQTRLDALTNALSEHHPAAVDMILQNAPPQNAPQTRTQQIQNGLRNIYATDRTNPLNVTNSAYSLAELDPTSDLITCDCKGAEADLLLAAYMMGNRTNSGFLSVENVDQAAEWTKNQMAEAAIPWGQSQEVLRGKVEGRTPEQLWDTAVQGVRQIEGAVSTVQSSLDVSALEAEFKRRSGG